MNERRGGLPEEATPRVTAGGLAFGAGAIWGLLGYAILWEGAPVTVDRPFVQSVPGTIALLPVRVVLWAIRGAEALAGRSFDLSRNHWWIALVAGAIGAAIAVTLTWAVRAALRVVRRSSAARGADAG